VIRILHDYLHQQKKTTLFERLRFIDESPDDDIAILFERDKDTGREFKL
jgi:hypothetical protein